MHGRRHRVRLLLTSALIVALAALWLSSGLASTFSEASAASAGETAATLPRPVPQVGVVGDSVLDMAEHDFFGDSSRHHLTDAFTSTGVTAEVSTHPGMAIRQLTPFALDLRDRHVDTIVVEGGHNDVRLVREVADDGEMLAQSKADIVRLLDALAGVRCVVLTTPRTATATWDLHTVGADLVAFYRSEAAKHPNVHVADWTSLADPHPEWFIEDGVHPNDAGVVALRALVVDTVASAC
jgi:lysophospholipase L1-like esterase